jgi:hypothetical protein
MLGTRLGECGECLDESCPRGRIERLGHDPKVNQKKEMTSIKEMITTGISQYNRGVKQTTHHSTNTIII